MGYRVLNAQGELVAGDDVLDDVLKAAALLVNGRVVDDRGVVVYSSPGHEEALRRSEEEATRLAAEIDPHDAPPEG